MIELTVSKLTDMTDHKIIPQITEEICTDITTKIDNVIYKKLFDMKIDKDILINQLKEIHRLNDVIREYEELEEKGLLKKFECAIGDTVYRINSLCEIYECTVQGIKQQFNTTSYFLHANINVDDYSVWVDKWFDRCQIGYEFYLTKRDAELELKRMRGEE